MAASLVITSSHCLQIQEVKCLLGCVLFWRRNPCPEAPAHTLLCSITQVRSHSSISNCQRRFLVVADWGLQRRGHSCWETALKAGISGINDLVSVVWVKGRHYTNVSGRHLWCFCVLHVSLIGMDFFPSHVGWHAFAQQLYTLDFVTCSPRSIALLFP